MSYLNIPAELREEKAWVNVWEGSKVPMQATVRKAASSSNPNTWSNYIAAHPDTVLHNLHWHCHNK